MKNPSLVTWVGWIAATMVAALIFTSFAYTNFETKDDAKEKKSDITQRLDRIENKVDAIKNEVTR